MNKARAKVDLNANWWVAREDKLITDGDELEEHPW